MIDYLPSNHATTIIIQPINSTNMDTIITSRKSIIKDFRPQPQQSPDKSAIFVDIPSDEESGGQIPPEVNNIVPTSDDVDNPRQSSDSPNNNARKTSSDEIQPLTKGSTGSGQSRADDNDAPRQSTEEEKQNFDKYVGEYTPVIAISFIGTSVILLINHMTMADHYPTLVDVQYVLNYLTCCTGVSLLFLCKIKLPNPRTAKYQFTLMVLGFFFIILCVAIRTFVALSPEISKKRTFWVVSLMIGSTGCFAGYVWSAARQTEDNRQSSVNGCAVQL